VYIIYMSKAAKKINKKYFGCFVLCIGTTYIFVSHKTKKPTHGNSNLYFSSYRSNFTYYSYCHKSQHVQPSQ
jgi:hypothetical protein